MTDEHGAEATEQAPHEVEATEKIPTATDVQIENIHVMLPCKLTVDQIADLAIEADTLVQQRQRNVKDLAETSTRLKDEIKSLDNQVARMLRDIGRRERDMNVACQCITDRKAGYQYTVRLDTKEEVSRRKPSKHELQGRLFEDTPETGDPTPELPPPDHIDAQQDAAQGTTQESAEPAPEPAQKSRRGRKPKHQSTAEVAA